MCRAAESTSTPAHTARHRIQTAIEWAILGDALDTNMVRTPLHATYVGAVVDADVGEISDGQGPAKPAHAAGWVNITLRIKHVAHAERC